MKIVAGNPKLIKKVTLDLGKYLGKFERHTPNQNNEFVVKMDSWGNIRQRPRLISVDFMNGQSRTYEHTLHLDDGFMSCPLSLKNSFEPIEYMVVDEVWRMRSEMAIHSKRGFLTQQR